MKGKRAIKWFYLNVADPNIITKIARSSLARWVPLVGNPLTGATVLLHQAAHMNSQGHTNVTNEQSFIGFTGENL